MPLSGTGEDFSMAASGSSTATVSAGQTASYTLVFAPAGGFKQTVSLTCTGVPAQSACSVPSSVTLNGSSPTSVTVSVTTAGASAALLRPNTSSPAGSRLALWLTLSGLPGLVLLGASRGRFRKRVSGPLYRLGLLCLLALGLTWSGCGSNGNGVSGTPVGTYNLTVTGSFTSGATTLTHNTKLTLVVQ